MRAHGLQDVCFVANEVALPFCSQNVGKAFHVSYEDKTKLVAYTQQVKHGVYDNSKITAVGYLDVIGQVSIECRYIPKVVYVSGEQTPIIALLSAAVLRGRTRGVNCGQSREFHVCY